MTNTTMREALDDPDLLGGILPGKTWSTWRTVLIAAMGERLSFWERRDFRKVTGRAREPGKRVDELIAVVGRRGGKSRAASVLAVYLAALCDYSEVQAPGERLRVLFLARSQDQAKVCFDYVAGVFDTIPIFRELVTGRTQDTISLANGIDLEVKSANAATIRGISAVAILADEAAFWQTDSASQNADTDILNAARPALATTGGPLVVISSPHARKGEVFDLWEKNYGEKGDPGIMVVHGESRTFNSSLSQAVVDRALKRNPAAAAAEYLAQWRSDLESFVTLDTLRACTGNFAERPPIPGVEYVGGIDFAGGSGEDSMALAFCHFDDVAQKVIVDFAKEWAPNFSPADVIAEVAGLCKRYGVPTLIGDAAFGDFPREMLRKLGIGYRKADYTTSGCFSELLPLLNSHECELPRHQVLLTQLGALERKPSSRGKEFIGHPPNCHDDVAAAVAVCVSHCAFADAKRIKWHAASERGVWGENGFTPADQVADRAQQDDDRANYRRGVCGSGNSADPVSEETRRRWLDPL